jgi:hypothetical protein
MRSLVPSDLPAFFRALHVRAFEQAGLTNSPYSSVPEKRYIPEPLDSIHLSAAFRILMERKVLRWHSVSTGFSQRQATSKV